ncbi:hypothetical protein [Parasitella parasitica]|uniref:Uncharacterized protein n=1 Tax=Parasitella parasitica TaxID=35722 RepID=A0A0B7NNQ0_9FUNG|nr:hypothetical protein [Parasitella parasitica]
MEKAYDPVKAAVRRFKTDYENEIEVFHFENETEFSEWYKHNSLSHATWIQQTRNYSKKVVPPGAILNPQDLKYTDFKRCDHHGKKPASPPAPVLQNEENCVVKRRKTKSIKVGCKANLKIKCFNDDSFEVTYNWRHSNHTPENIAKLSGSRLPEAAKQWIQEHVDKHNNWEGIKNFLRLDENQLNEIGNHGTFKEIPVAMLINYQDVQNAILAKLNAAARKHKSDGKRVVLWLEYLKENGYETMRDIPDNTDAPFVLSWYSPWHKKYLEAAEDWFLDSTHKTCVSFIDKRDCYLMTIVVHNPITSKDLPVAFFITSVKCSPTIERFLSWLKNNNNLKLKRIMTDCSATEQRAIISSFGSTIQIFLCHWHLQKAWEDHIKKISFEGDSADKKAARKLLRARLYKILYSEKEDGF